MYKRLTLIGAAVLAASTPLQAQDNTKKESFVLEEIIVTANKREESLQEVAMSVTAFGSEFFKDTGATGLGELEQYTPNLSIRAATDSRSTAIVDAAIVLTGPLSRR